MTTVCTFPKPVAQHKARQSQPSMGFWRTILALAVALAGVYMASYKSTNRAMASMSSLNTDIQKLTQSVELLKANSQHQKSQPDIHYRRNEIMYNKPEAPHLPKPIEKVVDHIDLQSKNPDVQIVSEDLDDHLIAETKASLDKLMILVLARIIEQSTDPISQKMKQPHIQAFLRSLEDDIRAHRKTLQERKKEKVSEEN